MKRHVWMDKFGSPEPLKRYGWTQIHHIFDKQTRQMIRKYDVRLVCSDVGAKRYKIGRIREQMIPIDQV